MIDLKQLTLGQLDELKAVLGGSPGRRLPMPVGKVVFVRTVTHHYVGRVAAVSEEEVALESASWVADDGRFSTAMSEGTLQEVEPYPPNRRVVLNRSSFCDWCEWPFELPTAAK